MPEIQIDFDDEENDIIECYKILKKLTKPEAVKELVKIAGESKEIKPTLEQRRKNKLTKQK